MTDAPAQARLSAAYRVTALLVRPFMEAMTVQDWRGGEHLPRTGGFVAAPNHVSYFDPFAVSHYLYDHGHPPYFLGKQEVFRIPVVGRLLLGAGQIPVYRRTGRAADAYRAAAAGVRAGKCVVVFPEGTLTRDPDLWPMVARTGAARVALATQCPLVPIAHWGSQDVLATYGRVVRLLPRRTMHVLAGRPLELTDLYGLPIDTAVLQRATGRLMERITGLLEVLRAERAPVERFDSGKHGLPETGNPHRRVR